ncbi:MAG: hypothetical protein ABI586_07985 [Candidatus Nanopelagicales bacterium]
MFVQVIKGRVSDPSKVKATLDRWIADVSPGANGWLGSTGGVTKDGQLIAIARFESEHAARANSNRPEQDAWWKEMEKNFDGEATFQDSTDVVTDTPGDPAKAGFVQIMQGRGTDTERARELMGQNPEAWAAFRPEILGSVSIGHDDGAYTMVLYFTSEEAAHEGEKKEPPAALQAEMDELNNLSIGMPDFYDITDPWMNSPK